MIEIKINESQILKHFENVVKYMYTEIYKITFNCSWDINLYLKNTSILHRHIARKTKKSQFLQRNFFLVYFDAYYLKINSHTLLLHSVTKNVICSSNILFSYTTLSKN